MEKIEIQTKTVSAYEAYLIIRDVMEIKEEFTTKDVVKYAKENDVKLITSVMYTCLAGLTVRKKALIRLREIQGAVGAGRQQLYKVVKKIDIKSPKCIEEKFDKPKVAHKKRILTLEDAKNMDEMDVAFIGYAFRTETEILQKKYELLSATNAELEKTKKNHTLVVLGYIKDAEKLQRENNNLKDNNMEKEKIIQNLNAKIKGQNLLIDRYKGEISTEQGERTTVKLGEIARFPKGKPSYIS